MPRIVIGLFSRREDAEAARRELMLSGIAQRRITLDCPEDRHDHGRDVDEPLPDDRGLAGFIGRMFSGAMLDHRAIDRYLLAARHAQCVLAVHELDDADVQHVHEVLAAHGALDADGRPAAAAGAARVDAHDADAAVIEPFGPDVYPLPNAPTGWGRTRSGSRSSIAPLRRDPARPHGLMRDAPGLGVDADRRRVGRTDDVGMERQETGRAPPENAGDKAHGDEMSNAVPGEHAADPRRR